MWPNNVQVQVNKFLTQSLCEKGAMQQTATTVNQDSCHLLGGLSFQWIKSLKL